MIFRLLLKYIIWVIFFYLIYSLIKRIFRPPKPPKEEGRVRGDNHNKPPLEFNLLNRKKRSEDPFTITHYMSHFQVRCFQQLLFLQLGASFSLRNQARIPAIPYPIIEQRKIM